MSEQESKDQFSSGEHKRIEMYGDNFAVCDTCINCLGLNIRWDQAPCQKERAAAIRAVPASTNTNTEEA